MFKSYAEASEAMWDWHKKHSKFFTGADCPDFAIQLQSGSSAAKTYYDVH